MSEQSSTHIQVGRDLIGVVNLGAISGNVTNTINQLPESTDPNQPSLKELLTQLQSAIESDTVLSDEAKGKALEEVGIIGEAAQQPKDSAKQTAAKNALTFFDTITMGMSKTTKFAQECGKLLPAITALLAFV